MGEQGLTLVEANNKLVSRRRALSFALTLGMAGLAGAAVRGAESRVGVEKELSEKRPQLDGPIQIGNLSLYGLPMPHSKEDWEKWGGVVEKLVAPFPLLIPEYLPSEYSQLEEDPNPLVRAQAIHYRESNFLFNKLESLAVGLGKEVWMVDPAYTVQFGLFREMLHTPQSLVTGFAAIAGLETAVKLSDVIAPDEIKRLRRLYREPRGRLNRADFLRLVGGLGIALAVDKITSSMIPGLEVWGETGSPEMGSSEDPAIAIERDFRRVVISEFLQQIGEKLSVKTPALTVYHNYHWDAIKAYLGDAKTRKERLSGYSWVRNIKMFEHFFRARNYLPANGGMQLKGELQLT